MKKFELTKIRRQVEEAGGPSDKLQILKIWIGTLTHEIARLDNEKANVQKDYCKKLEAWTSEPVEANQVPFAIPQDLRDARLYKIAALACLLLEAFLAGSISIRIGLPWWSGALFSVLLKSMLDGALWLVFRNIERPKEALGKIKRWPLLLSIFMALTSLATVLLARTVEGEIALMLLPAFGIALWLATLGVLFLSSVLFVAAHILEWSYKHSDLYRAVGQEKLFMESQKGLLEDELNKLNAAILSHQRPQALPGGVIGVIGFLMFSLSWLVNHPAAAQELKIDIYIDATGSPYSESLATACSNVLESLPQVIIEDFSTELNIYHFGEDSWVSVRKAHIEFPKLIPQKTRLAGEFSKLRNIQQAIASEMAIEKEKNREIHRDKIKQELSKLKSVVLPDTDAIARCSDVQGVLTRIAMSSITNKVAVVITDGAETCSSFFKSIPPPKNDLILVILLVPEKGVKNRSYEQFEHRRNQLQEAVPWVAAITPFFEDFSTIFSEIRDKQSQYGAR